MTAQTIIQEKLRRSPFFYVGDKFKLIPQLKENFPKNINRFIEPFCGGGSVFLNIEAQSYYLNDIDSNIINLHKFLQSYSQNTQDFWREIKNIIEKYNLSATFMERGVPSELKKQFVKTYFAFACADYIFVRRFGVIKEQFRKSIQIMLML